MPRLIFIRRSKDNIPNYGPPFYDTGLVENMYPLYVDTPGSTDYFQWVTGPYNIPCDPPYPPTGSNA